MLLFPDLEMIMENKRCYHVKPSHLSTPLSILKYKCFIKLNCSLVARKLKSGWREDINVSPTKLLSGWQRSGGPFFHMLVAKLGTPLKHLICNYTTTYLCFVKCNAKWLVGGLWLVVVLSSLLPSGSTLGCLPLSIWYMESQMTMHVILGWAIESSRPCLLYVSISVWSVFVWYQEDVFIALHSKQKSVLSFNIIFIMIPVGIKSLGVWYGLGGA